MGVGIEARSVRCRSFWEAHLESSRRFVLRSVTGLPPGRRIAVLGAGRLLDVPLAELLDHGFEVHLFDVDPGCERVWRRMARGRSVQAHIVDLTGSFVVWTRELAARVKQRPARGEVEQFLSELQPVKPPPLAGFDIVISLNLLSQLPVYWRDRVEVFLGRRNSAWLTEESFERALSGSCACLQAAHLELIGGSGAHRAVVITDTEFYFYEQTQAPWQVEPSIYVPGVELPGYLSTHRESWLWHIAPQGVEQSDYGSIHRVEAFEFRRLSSGAAGALSPHTE